MFEVSLVLSEKESATAQDEVSRLLKPGQNTVFLDRQIVYQDANNMVWRTSQLQLNSHQIVLEGAFNETSSIVSALPPTTEGEREWPANLAEKVVAWLVQVLNNQFFLIPCNRDRAHTPQPLGQRSAFLDDTVTNRIIGMGQTTGLERRKWLRLASDFSSLTPTSQALSVIQNQLIVDEKDLNFPIANVGGGTQALVILQNLIRESDSASILGIEEPETHFHPELAKKFYRFLKGISSERQMWMTTHSPFFVDRPNLDEVWHIHLVGKQTEITRISDTKELWAAIFDMGVRPSDLLFADAILLVEGETEEAVFPIWARSLDGFNLLDYVSIIPVHSDTKAKRNLKMWVGITQKNFQIPMFLVLDSHAQAEVESILAEHLIPADDCLVLEHKSVEDYYPRELLSSALEELYNIPAKDQESVLKLEDGRGTALKKLLSRHNGSKVDLGKAVAEKMSPEQVPEQLKHLFETIRLYRQA